MPTRTEAISRYLVAKTHKDLSCLYNRAMEVQVNVAQDNGSRVEGDYEGRQWHGWTDGLTTWKSFRIPYKAATKPEYDDKEISFDLAEHVESIGMTGWDWEAKVSRWVAYDFDAIVGHSDKTALTNDQLDEIKNTTSSIPWITIRKSTSGHGLHLYVFLDCVPTANHTEHAALARAILGTLSAITGYDFHSKVDACGGNMWVWHRKMLNTDGLNIIKQGEMLLDIPANWRDHIKVISGIRRKNLPQDIESSGRSDSFEELAGQRPMVALDTEHKKIISYFRETNAFWYYDQDNHMVITHTYWLKKAYNDLHLKGFFETDSPATNINEQNCFCFPIRRGGWSVRRFTPGVHEHESWIQDGNGWTKCYYNTEPDLATACRTYGGLEDPDGGFIFREAEMAAKAANLLGVFLTTGTSQNGRKTKLKQHKDGRLIAEVEYDNMDRAEEMSGWLVKKDHWTKIYNLSSSVITETEVSDFDDLVRHLVTTSGEDYGWVLKSDNIWRTEPLNHVKIALSSMGYPNKDIIQVVGSAVFKAWVIVNKPFQSEYPGSREWNRNAAQFKFLPSKNKDVLSYPTWTKILAHCGAGLDTVVALDPWCKVNGLINGGDYLKCWVASLFQYPTEPLPYLAFWGPQKSGKSIFHEALSLLLTSGYTRANAALESKNGFNAELEGMILCIAEELNLRADKVAYNRIKDWVTSPDIQIHAKGQTPYHIKNTCHFIQVANDHSFCPIFPGDTRITLCYVSILNPMELIPKKTLIPMLEKEASDFLAGVLALELPESHDRLNVPVLDTFDKTIVEEQNKTMLEIFMQERCKETLGAQIKFSEFYETFQQWLPTDEIPRWSKIKVGRDLPPKFPKGRSRADAQFFIGNIAWMEDEQQYKGRYIISNGFLDLVS